MTRLLSFIICLICLTAVMALTEKHVLGREVVPFTTGEYNYGARRHYAPALNWTTPDPKAPDYNWLSPYSFCAANPVKYIDPTGQDAEIVIDGTTITITANVILTGKLANNTLVDVYQNNINQTWGNNKIFVGRTQIRAPSHEDALTAF